MSLRASTRPDMRIVAALCRAEAVALLLAATTAAGILICWMVWGVTAAAPVLWSKMTANSAMGVLTGVASLALLDDRRPSRQLLWGRIAAAAVLALGTATLFEYLTGLSLGIDTLLPCNHALKHPGRISPQTALGFVLLGLTLLAIRASGRRRATVADFLALSFVAFTLVMIGGYLYDAIQLVGIDAAILMAPQTLFCLSCIAFVTTARRARQGDGLLAVIVNLGIGGQLIRMVLPVAIVLPFVFYGSIAYVIEARPQAAPYARAIASAVESFMIFCLAVWLARRTNALEQELRELSLTDELTQVYNRRGFYFLGQQAFRNADRGDNRMTVFFLDLDGLKTANDTYGHDAGSVMIQSLAAALVDTFRRSDIVGRVGGDEFAVATLSAQGDGSEILHRLERAIAQRNAAADTGAQIRYSIGVAELKDSKAETFDDLVAEADERMYQDKLRRRSSTRPEALRAVA